MSQVVKALLNFIDKTLELNDAGHFVTDFDPAWRSECEFKQVGNTSRWKPCKQQKPVNFSGLANAAEAEIHADILAFYGAFWSGSLQGKSTEGPVSLIQLWNHEDFERLVENLIGHLLSKQRAKLPFTVFFATTEPDSELFLSIENRSGKILLEEPGQPPIREVDPDLTSFLNRLEATRVLPGIY